MGGSESVEVGMRHERGDVDEAYDHGVVNEVIRPAAIVPEDAARAILVELSLNSVHADGHWLAEPSRWHRYERPWTGESAADACGLIGTVQVAYGTPTKYEITIYRVTITKLGATLGWTVRSLSDEALGFGALSLDQCPRAALIEPPKPFRF
jgi:hypothetical protein